MARRAFACMFALLVLSFSSRAVAAHAALYVDGPHAAEIRRDVAAAVNKRTTTGTSKALDGAVHGTSDIDGLAHALSRAENARPLARAVRAALDESGADVAVVIAVSPADGDAENVAILLVPRGGPALLHSAELPAMADPKMRVAWWSKTFHSPDHPPERIDETEDSAPVAAPPGGDETTPDDEELASPYAGAAPASPTAPHAAPSARRDDDTPVAPRARNRMPRYLVRAVFEMSVRDFTDTEAGRGAPRTYHAFPIPAVAIAAEAYPLFGVLGLDASIAQSVALTSTTNDRRTVDTTWLRAVGALRGRIPFGQRDDSPWVAVFAGYGYSRFAFDSAPPGREIPTGQYQYLRFGSDARLAVQRVRFSFGAEFDRVIAIGALGPTHAEAPGNGVTAHAGAGLQIAPWLYARLDGQLTWLTYGLVRSVSAHAEDRYMGFSAGGEAVF